MNSFFRSVCNTLGLNPTLKNIRDWKEGNYEFKKIDLTESFCLRSQNDVAAWIQAAAPLVRGKHQGTSAYQGETIYIGQKSRRIALKIYNKWRELQKHKLPEELPHREKILEYAKPLLRVEIRILSMELKHRGLHKAYTWRDQDIIPAIFHERISGIKMNEKMRLTTEEIQDLPPRLLAVYKLWEQGEDIKAMYPRRTFYRYRSELVKHGIDITVKKPSKKNNVVPLIRYLTAEHVAETPSWAEPIKIKNY